MMIGRRRTGRCIVPADASNGAGSASMLDPALGRSRLALATATIVIVSALRGKD